MPLAAFGRCDWTRHEAASGRCGSAWKFALCRPSLVVRAAQRQPSCGDCGMRVVPAIKAVRKPRGVESTTV